MKRTLIRYKTKPELADKNAELIAGVFAELQAAKVEGVRYLSLRLDDGTFVHFVETDADDGPPSSAIIGCLRPPSPWISNCGQQDEIDARYIGRRRD